MDSHTAIGPTEDGQAPSCHTPVSQFTVFSLSCRSWCINTGACIHDYTMPYKSAVESLEALSRCPGAEQWVRAPRLVVSEPGKDTSEVTLAPQFRGKGPLSGRLMARFLFKRSMFPSGTSSQWGRMTPCHGHTLNVTSEHDRVSL